jgi:hypothetical protein
MVYLLSIGNKIKEIIFLHDTLTRGILFKKEIDKVPSSSGRVWYGFRLNPIII